MFKREHNSILNFFIVIILVIIFFYILYIWAEIIIPFIISVLFAFAILWLSNFYNKFKIPKFFSFLFSILTYSIIFYFIWKIIWNNVWDLIEKLPSYQEKIKDLLTNIFTYFWLKEPTSLSQVFSNIDLQSTFSTVFNSLATTFSNIWLIFIYTIFILIEASNFREKLSYILENNSQKKSIFGTIKKIKQDVKSYFFIKWVVSLITWFLTYFITLSFWLNFPAFWWLLAFTLNFVPNIGSILAVVFPAILSFVQPNFELNSALFMISFLTWLQLLMWNIVEPKFMWNRLNLSPLVIILSLIFWWQIWWIMWMLLSVPIMVIINIVLASIKQTRPVAILLSEKWVLQIDAIETKKKKKKIFGLNIK